MKCREPTKVGAKIDGSFTWMPALGTKGLNNEEDNLFSEAECPLLSSRFRGGWYSRDRFHALLPVIGVSAKTMSIRAFVVLSEMPRGGDNGPIRSPMHNPPCSKSGLVLTYIRCIQSKCLIILPTRVSRFISL